MNLGLFAGGSAHVEGRSHPRGGGGTGSYKIHTYPAQMISYSKIVQRRVSGVHSKKLVKQVAKLYDIAMKEGHVAPVKPGDKVVFTSGLDMLCIKLVGPTEYKDIVNGSQQSNFQETVDAKEGCIVTQIGDADGTRDDMYLTFRADVKKRLRAGDQHGGASHRWPSHGHSICKCEPVISFQATYRQHLALQLQWGGTHLGLHLLLVQRSLTSLRLRKSEYPATVACAPIEDHCIYYLRGCKMTRLFGVDALKRVPCLALCSVEAEEAAAPEEPPRRSPQASLPTQTSASVSLAQFNF